MLLANRAETGLSCYLVPLHSPGKRVSGAAKEVEVGWWRARDRWEKGTEGGPQDCRDLVCVQDDTLNASNTFLEQVTAITTKICFACHICHYALWRMYSDLRSMQIRSKLRQQTCRLKLKQFSSLTSFLPAQVNFVLQLLSKHTCAYKHALHVHMQTHRVHMCSMWGDDAHSLTTLLLTWPTCLSFTTLAQFPTAHYLTLEVFNQVSGLPKSQNGELNIVITTQNMTAF